MYVRINSDETRPRPQEYVAIRTIGLGTAGTMDNLLGNYLERD